MAKPHGDERRNPSRKKNAPLSPAQEETNDMPQIAAPQKARSGAPRKTHPRTRSIFKPRTKAPNFALSVASYYPERCLAFPAVLLIAADAVLLSELFSGKAKLPVLCTAAVLVLSTLYWGVFGFADITNVYLQVRANEGAIAEAAARGESSVTVPYIETLTRYSALYDLQYLDTEDAQSWPNDAMADVLGIGEIRCEPDAAKEAE